MRMIALETVRKCDADANKSSASKAFIVLSGMHDLLFLESHDAQNSYEGLQSCLWRVNETRKWDVS